MFTGKKRVGAERAKEKCDIYLFTVYFLFFYLILVLVLTLSIFKAPNYVLARTLTERVV